MTANRVGGTESDPRYAAIFVVGVLLGSMIRLVAYLFPERIVATLEDLLLGDLK